MQAGQKVLVIGASGGAATFAAQIAKSNRAEITGAHGGIDRRLRALLLFPLVSQKLSTFIASENSAR